MKSSFDLEKEHLYFDNAASTPQLNCVRDSVTKFLNNYGSIHRGHGKFSTRSTESYEQARTDILKMVNGKPERDGLFFVSNTSDGLNRLALLFKELGDIEILTTDIEHSANLLPWIKTFDKVHLLKTNEDFEINLDKLEQILIANENIKVVTISGASNVTGIKTDIKSAYKICKKHNRYLVIDASQYAPHFKIDMDDADVFVMSGHKMYAPYGIGAVVARKEILALTKHSFSGGGNVCYVSEDHNVYYKDNPYNQEIGTPNGVGAIAMATAMNHLYNEVGFNFLDKHNEELCQALYEELNQTSLKIVFPKEKQYKNRSPLLIADHDNLEKLADYLYENDVSVRLGAFCVYRFIEKIKGKIDYNMINCNDYKEKGLLRISCGLMTNKEDVIKLKKIIQEFDRENA